MKQILIVLNVLIIGVFTKYMIGITAYIIPVVGKIIGREMIAIGDRLKEEKWLISDLAKLSVLNLVYIEVFCFAVHCLWQWIAT